MRGNWWTLSAVACGTFMATLDASIVNIALPTLTKDLEADLAYVKWVVIAYLLAITCLLLPFGRLSDTHGRKKVFQIGFAVFSIGSALCAIAPSLLTLVVARTIQGVGASMLMANGPAIVTAAFPQSIRGSALGALGMVVSLGLITGPVLGGLLIGAFGWPVIFAINLPLGLLGFLLAQAFVPPDRAKASEVDFDWAGSLLQSISVVFFILAFETMGSLEPTPVATGGFGARNIAMGAAAILVGSVFLIHEARTRFPLFDLDLLKDRVFLASTLASFFVFVAFSSLTVLMPFFLEDGIGLSIEDTGAVMSAIPFAVFVAAPASGRISDRIGTRWLCFLGASIAAVALFAMAGAFGAGIHENTAVSTLGAALACMGLATGIFQSPNNSAILSCVPTDKLGSASATLAAVRNLGMVGGTGLSTALFHWRRGTSADLVPALHVSLAAAGVVALAAALATVFHGPTARTAPRAGAA